MPVVTFWSNSEKTIGQTVAASAAATAMAIERNYKVLLISVDFNNPSMENCFGAQQSNNEVLKSIIAKPKINLDTGISGLLKIAKSNRVTPEVIKDYTKIIFKNRLEVLYSSNNTEMSIEEQLECYKTIILNASKYYDHIFVDLKKGLHHRQILDILEMSTAIVLTTEQGIQTLQEFYDKPEMAPFINANKVIWTMCRYDKNSKFNTRNLTRTIWKKGLLYAIPYNTLLFEASQEGGIAEFLLRVRTMKAEDENTELFKELNNLVEGILYKYQELRMRR